MMVKSKELSKDLHNLIIEKQSDGIGYRPVSKMLNAECSCDIYIVLITVIYRGTES